MPSFTDRLARRAPRQGRPSAGRSVRRARLALAAQVGRLRQRTNAARQNLVRRMWLTSLGWRALAFAVVCLGLGWRLGWDEFLVLGTALMVLLLVASLLSLGQARLEIRLTLQPQRVVVGDRAAGAAAVRNIGRQAMLPVRLELPVGRGVAQFDLPPFNRDEEQELSFVIPTSRRSIVTVGPVRSVRGDPLNLMRREVSWGGEMELFVHPRTVDLGGLAAGWLRDLEGQTTNDISPSDLAFHTLREYVPGDDRRHIHWRTSARVGTLMVRQFVDTRRSHLAIVLGCRAEEYADPDEFELAVSMAASLGRRVLLDGHSVTCIGGDRLIASHRAQALLDGMAGVELRAGGADLASTALQAVRYARGASVLALVGGAATTMGTYRSAVDRFAPNVKAFALRADQNGRASLHRHDRFLAVTVPSLDSLAAALWSASQR